jgi:hypothetical protein
LIEADGSYNKAADSIDDNVEEVLEEDCPNASAGVDDEDDDDNCDGDNTDEDNEEEEEEEEEAVNV